MDFQLGFNRLEENIIDSIIEEQIKLGYESETLRLYYPISSILNILGVNADSPLSEILEEFKEYCKERLGELNISIKKKRICIAVPPFGVGYVHEQVEVPEFWVEFINLMRKHDICFEEIKAVFLKYSSDVKVEEFAGEDFDYAISFNSGYADDYVYCIKFEAGGHVIYHRFIKEDYRDLFKDEEI